MARVWSRAVVGAALGAVTLFGLGGVALAAEGGRVKQSPGPEPGSPEQMEYFADECRKELQRPPTAAPGVGRMENVTSPGPGVAVAGDVIDVSLSWDRPTSMTPGSRRSSTASRSTARPCRS